MSRSARQLIELARTDLIIDLPFFGTLMLMLRPQAMKSLHTYAGTDGKYLYYNPDMLEKLSIDKVKGIIIHEVLHCAFGHFAGHRANRTGDRDPLKWNIACDLIINKIVMNSHLDLPEKCCFALEDGSGFTVGDKTIHFTKTLTRNIMEHTAEQLYSLIPEPPKIKSCIASAVSEETKKSLDRGQAPGCGMLDPATGEKDRADGTGGSGPKKMDDVDSQIWKAQLDAAMRQAKQQGTLPGGFEEVIDNLYPPKKNWEEELARWVQRVYDDFTYRTRRRVDGINLDLKSQGITYEIILPELGEGEVISDLVIAIDTSGSVSSHELKEFLSEVTSIAQKGINLWLCYCDAAVHYFGELTMESMPHPKGRGGTSFIPVFDEIEKRGLNCEAVVYFTDSYGSFPTSPPPYSVVWVINNEEGKVPWGEIIRYETHREEDI